MGKRIIDILLDGMQPELFISHFIVMVAGAFVMFYFTVKISIKHDKTTPNKFSFKFMVFDNIPRLIAVWLFVAASIIFYDEMNPGAELTLYNSFKAGLGIDAVIGTLAKGGKETGQGKAKREKLIKKYSK